ncbi:restriction endonuclease subunit S [Alkalihalobacillus oceani]|uniref:restriction endonuclease subunit S n=1 Tax=Halalkalibacter oceani TaxID=1653776 RepID=UPI00204239C1|nr:restriction endonuclease subunit S [Halalkalibacter oceani]MCM3763229.1 restriction endonuclease subunit S [Halalkalibacter oceani]
MKNWRKYEFGEVVTLSKEKYNPKKEKDNFICIELEHLESDTGRLLGHTDSITQQSVKNKFKPGSVLFGKLRPYLKKFHLPNFHGVCSSEIWVLEGNEGKLRNEYLYCLVQTNKFTQNANKSAGSKMPRADWNYVSEVIFTVPPLEEQQKIASILSIWNKAIELKEKLIEQKKEQKKGLMQKLLTGEVRLPGFDGEWEEYEVQEICSLGRGRVISKKEIAKNIGTYPVYSSQTSDEGKIGSINTYDFDGEYITWTTDGANAGTVFYRNGKFNCTNVCGILKLNKDNIDARYLSYILQANTDKYVVRHGNPKLMNNIMAIIPVRIFNNYNYQKYICDLFDVLDKEIKLFEKEVKEIKHQKQGLMQQLLTGKIRVKV